MITRPARGRDARPAASVDVDDEGHMRVGGELTFGSVREACQRGLDCIEGRDRVVIDLEEVERSDSAGLALILEWLRAAKRGNARVSLRNVPEQMLAIAAATRLDGLLTRGQAS